MIADVAALPDLALPRDATERFLLDHRVSNHLGVRL